MSLRNEQYQSLMLCRKLMFDLLYPKARPKRVSELRRRVHQALRHYPPLKPDGEPIWSKH